MDQKNCTKKVSWELALKRKTELPTRQKFSNNFSKSEEINKKLFVLQIFSPVFCCVFPLPN